MVIAPFMSDSGAGIETEFPEEVITCNPKSSKRVPIKIYAAAANIYAPKNLFFEGLLVLAISSNVPTAVSSIN